MDEEGVDDGGAGEDGNAISIVSLVVVFTAEDLGAIRGCIFSKASRRSRDNLRSLSLTGWFSAVYFVCVLSGAITCEHCEPLLEVYPSNSALDARIPCSY